MEFVRFMLSMDTQLQMASVGQMPVLTASSQGDALSKQPQYFGIFLEQLKNAQARTPSPVWTQMEQILTDSGTAILSGKAPVQQALDDASAKIDKLLGQ